MAALVRPVAVQSRRATGLGPFMDPVGPLRQRVALGRTSVLLFAARPEDMAAELVVFSWAE